MKTIIWKLTPVWLGNLIFKTTGFLFSAIVDDGKVVRLYFQSQENFQAQKEDRRE